ncbi:hypothetical protein Dsin_016409 [Dipteronia sinensis]|uniref:Uncharacterized protein n=1 Tax=Dipteronia sinensis TaxID=43782 RepID=A0AAE0E6X9_9ROSI|nr:hypothetical protein Dsin_016409 [Dipteronia sinensis]
MLILIEKFNSNFDITVLTKSVEQETHVGIIIFIFTIFDKTFHILKSPDGLTCKTSSNQSPDQNQESGGDGYDAVLVHLDDELPSDIELSNFGENVDNEIVGRSGERVGRERTGIMEKSEGNFGRVLETKEGLVDEMRRESDAVKLEGGFHGVEGVVVSENDFGEQFGVV